MAQPPLVLVAMPAGIPPARRWKSSYPPLLLRSCPARAPGVRIVDGEHMRYGVLSTDETRAFKQRWASTRNACVLHRTGHGVHPADDPPSDQGYVFAGGNTNRDFRLLVDAADGLDVPVRSPRRGNRPVVAGQRDGDVVPMDVYERMMRGRRW